MHTDIVTLFPCEINLGGPFVVTDALPTDGTVFRPYNLGALGSAKILNVEYFHRASIDQFFCLID